MQNMKVRYILKTLQSWCSDSLEPFLHYPTSLGHGAP